MFCKANRLFWSRRRFQIRMEWGSVWNRSLMLLQSRTKAQIVVYQKAPLYSQEVSRWPTLTKTTRPVRNNYKSSAANLPMKTYNCSKESWMTLVQNPWWQPRKSQLKLMLSTRRLAFHRTISKQLKLKHRSIWISSTPRYFKPKASCPPSQWKIQTAISLNTRRSWRSSSLIRSSLERRKLTLHANLTVSQLIATSVCYSTIWFGSITISSKT